MLLRLLSNLTSERRHDSLRSASDLFLNLSGATRPPVLAGRLVDRPGREAGRFDRLVELVARADGRHQLEEPSRSDWRNVDCFDERL
jgi:hypothetical protein